MRLNDRTIYGLAGVFALAIVASDFAVPARASESDPLNAYASTANSVKLPDGRQFHLVCMGKGSPTVILTAGLINWSGDAWNTVQPAMARTTRVCAWDRPGFGLSDGTAAKTTVATNTADLETALALASIKGPYIMVGHSLGAYETWLFADRNPKKVVGIVLVDPSVPDQWEQAQRGAALMHLPTGGPSPVVTLWRKCAEDVRGGALKVEGNDPDGCFMALAVYPEPLKRALEAQLVKSPLQFETAASFLADGSRDGSKLVINPKRNYGDMPLVELTSAIKGEPPPGVDPAVITSILAEQEQTHVALAAQSRRGQYQQVEGAAHFIQQDKPQVVIDAVQSVVDQARRGG